jgi:uncharacterized protein (DUF1499 family)
MKAKPLTYTTIILATLLVAILGYIRLAPSDVARWHVDPATAFVPNNPMGQVTGQTDGATLHLAPADGLLAKLDAIAMATPRTQRLAGSVADGRITWVTRSALWGFPDYTTADQRPEGIYIHSRLRFGKSDLGINAARLTDWKSKL